MLALHGLFIELPLMPSDQCVLQKVWTQAILITCSRTLLRFHTKLVHQQFSKVSFLLSLKGHFLFFSRFNPQQL